PISLRQRLCSTLFVERRESATEVAVPSRGAESTRGRPARLFARLNRPEKVLCVALQSQTVPALPEVPQTIQVCRFKVVRHGRELLVDGRPVELGGRAFDTLVALIDARGTVLTKDELMSRVWPDRVVEENNLPAQIFTLRRVLGPDRDLIRTVAGRGYQFT